MKWNLYKNKNDLLRKISYWSAIAEDELGDFSEFVGLYEQLAEKGVFRIFEDEYEKSVFAFMVAPDLRGGLYLGELFMYIKPEYRGSISFFKSMIKNIENYAKNEGCNAIEIGSNCGYKDDKTINALVRLFGYKHYSVRKEI